jgi:hypothetical protein
MSQDIREIPTEEVIVRTTSSPSVSTIGSKEFIEEFAKELKSGRNMRTPNSLASKLGVDSVELAKWMDRCPELIRKPGKEDGVFYYGLAVKMDNTDQESKKLTRTVIKEEDRYCAAALHMIYGELLRTLEKYAIPIHDKSKEAFTALMEARDKLSAGTVLFQSASKVDTDKLPKL